MFDYCFGCGEMGLLDSRSMLCERCYPIWPHRPVQGASQDVCEHCGIRRHDSGSTRRWWNCRRCGMYNAIVDADHQQIAWSPAARARMAKAA